MECSARMRGAPWPVDSHSSEARRACMKCTVRCHEVHRVWSHDRFDACPKCTSACNSDSNMPFFFKYVTMSMESTYYKPAMEVPFDFARAYISHSVCHVELEGPNRTLWIIKVKHQPKECTFSHGWKDFAASHALAGGDALLFQLMASTGNSKCHFLVKVFKQSPQFIGKPHANSLPNFHPHKDKHPKIDAIVEQYSGLHKAQHAETRDEGAAVSKPLQLSKEDKPLEVKAHALMPSRELEDIELNVNALKRTEARIECNPEMRTLNMDIKREEKPAKTYTNKGEPSILDSPNKRPKSGDENPFGIKPKPHEMCANAKANVFTYSEEDTEINVNGFKLSETSTEWDSDICTPNVELMKQEVEQAETFTDKGVESSSKLKNNASLHDATGSYVKRKTAVEAMAKITSFYNMRSFKGDMTKPSSLSLGNTHNERKAAMQAIANNINKYETAGNKTLPSAVNHGLKDNQRGSRHSQAHHNNASLSFLKTMFNSNVNSPFVLHIPNSFTKSFMEQTKAEASFDFTLTLEQTCSKTKESMQGVAGQSWTAHCTCSAAGALVLTRGWREFACANELKFGDVCIFKLVERFTFMIQILPGCHNRHLET